MRPRRPQPDTVARLQQLLNYFTRFDCGRLGTAHILPPLSASLAPLHHGRPLLSFASVRLSASSFFPASASLPAAVSCW